MIFWSTINFFLEIHNDVFQLKKSISWTVIENIHVIPIQFFHIHIIIWSPSLVCWIFMFVGSISILYLLSYWGYNMDILTCFRNASIWICWAQGYNEQSLVTNTVYEIKLLRSNNLNMTVGHFGKSKDVEMKRNENLGSLRSRENLKKLYWKEWIIYTIILAFSWVDVWAGGTGTDFFSP